MTAADTNRLQMKQQIREQTRARRRELPEKDRLSRVIGRRLVELAEYRCARTVMFYVHVRNEVRTQHLLPEVWTEGKRMVVPYCVKGRIRLFELRSLDELAPGTLGVLEPRRELRDLPERKADVADVDLVVVPGLAFDRCGGRIGYGKGYYDKLLEHARPETALIALAFECQLVDRIPNHEHDVPMHKIVTEARVWECDERPRTGGD